MDPVTIVGLVEGSISLALQCGSVAKSLNNLTGQYRYAKLTISTMVQNLDIMQLAWDRIGAWSKNYRPAENDGFTQRLERFLETGSLVLDALEEDLKSYDVSDMKTFTQRARLVWNENILEGHQNRIRDQAQSMTLLLQAIQLPTLQDTNLLLEQSKRQFMKSDESALSIIPSTLSSRLSVSTHRSGDCDSIKGYATMEYRRFSFEDDLFTATVYKRNYRNARSQGLGGKKPKPDRETVALLNAKLKIEAPSILKASTPVSDLSEGVNDETKNLPRPPPNAILVTTSVTVSAEENNRDLEQRSISPAPDLFLEAFEDLEFFEACYEGDNSKVKDLLSMRPERLSILCSRSCDSVNICPIHATVFNGHVEVMETLLRHTDPSYQFGRFFGNAMYCKGENLCPPLHLAAGNGDLSMVELLLANDFCVSEPTDHGAKAGQARYGIQPIHLAAEAGSKEVLAALLAAGADENCVDRVGRQPLHYISNSRDLPEVIEYLVERGANVNGPDDSEGPTPVYLACENDFAGNLKSLLFHGARADKSSRFQSDSALDTAIRHSSPLCVEILLRHGVNPNCCRLDGRTGLHTFALEWYHSIPGSRKDANHKVILRLLLDQIDLLAKDESGHTVLDSLFSLWDESMALTWLELARLFLENLPAHKTAEKVLLEVEIRNSSKSQRWIGP